MKAYKCDRCGKYYNERIYYPIEAEPFSVILTSQIGVDFCSECADSLSETIKEWMVGGDKE